MSATRGPRPGPATGTTRTSLSGTATSLTARVRTCSARVRRVCSSGSSRPSDTDSAIISDSSTVETVMSSSSFGVMPTIRMTTAAHQL